MPSNQRTRVPRTTSPWDGIRHVREPIAWALLALTAVVVLVSAGQLFNLGGAQVPVANPVPASSSVASPGPASSPAPQPAPVSGPATGPNFAARASVAGPQFLGLFVTALPVVAIILVVFSGGIAERARQVTQTAAVVLAVDFVLGVVGLVGVAQSHTRPGTWFVLAAPELAVVGVALVFAGAVLWSPALRSQQGKRA